MTEALCLEFFFSLFLDKDEASNTASYKSALQELLSVELYIICLDLFGKDCADPFFCRNIHLFIWKALWAIWFHNISS